ncbi:hypothetical protein COOONC_17854 [Cooperia oncophora]
MRVQSSDKPEDGEPQTIHPNKEQLSRRYAIVPEQPHQHEERRQLKIEINRQYLLRKSVTKK